MAQAFAHLDIQAPVHKILQEHRAGHYDLEKAVYLLKRYTLRQSEAAQRDIFDTLWSVLSTEPLSPSSQKGAYILCVQAVIIRSVAEFGPTPELPARVFGLLKWDAPPECMAFWAQLVCSQLSYSMFHNAQRFSQATLDNAKDLCGTYTSGQSNTLNQRTFPEPVVFSVRGLEEAIQSIEAARFADHIETEHDPQEDTAMTGDRSGGSPTPKEVRRRIFIGHGGSPLWRELKDFISDRLHLEWDEFNRESVAGLSTKERLQKMLDDATFAFLVMTAEDERPDGTLHPRDNVIHELGLFQGRLGFERAIVLLEEGCAEFSNIHGLTQIRFPKGNIAAKFEEIRRVLEREALERKSEFHTDTAQWVQDKKLQEFHEVLDIIVERKEAILLAKSSGLVGLDSHQQAEEYRKRLAASHVFQTRLLIYESLKQIQAPQKWNEIERMADDPNVGVTQCSVKLNELIESIRVAAEEVTRQ